MRILTNEAAVILALGEGPSSGVGVMRRLHSGGPGRGDIAAGTLYPLVRRLEKAGLVRRWAEVARTGVGRPRRFLELTPRGVAELDRIRERLCAPSSGPTTGRFPPKGTGMRANLRRGFQVSALARRLRDAGATR